MEAGPTLEALLASTVEDDQNAFRILYDRTSAKLFGIVLSILKDQAKSEDVLQSVYLSIWKRAGTYTVEQGSPITWMSTVARNNAIDVMRATRPEGAAEISDSEEELFRSKGVGTDSSEYDNLEALRFCLGEMKGDDRNYVLLSYYEGYSREDLASRFELSVVAIKTRLRRGLIGLRRCLERD